MRLNRLSDLLAPHTDPALTPDEAARHDDGAMDPEERADIDAYLATSPLARFDQEEFRRQRELEAKPVVFDDPPSALRWPSWPLPLALAASAALAAFFVGRASKPAPASRLTIQATARLQEDVLRTQLNEARRGLAELQIATRKQGADASSKIRALEEYEKKAGLLAARLAQTEAALARAQTAPARVAMRADGPETKAFLRKLLDGPAFRGGARAPASLPTLLAPPAEARGSLVPLNRLVLILPKARVPYDWDLWRLEGEVPRRRIGVRASIDGDRAILIPATPLREGRYAVGARPAEPGTAKSEEERPWRVYRFGVLGPVEAERRQAARRYGPVAPLAAAADLFALGRLGEAAELLRSSGEAPEIRRALGTWQDAARRGDDLRVPPDTLQESPPTGEVPVDVAVQTASERPLSGDSLKALTAMFVEAQKIDPKGPNAPRRLKLLREGFAMAQRLDRPWGVAKIGFLLLQDLGVARRYEEAEPYFEPTFEAGRRAVRELAPGEDSEDLSKVYFGARYFAGGIYRLTGRLPKALATLREGQDYVRSIRNDAYLAALTFQEALVRQAMGDAIRAESLWRDTLGLLARTPPGSVKTELSWAEQYGTAEGNLAACQYGLGEYRGAIETCDRALRRRDVLSRPVQAFILTARATVRVELGEDGPAKKDFEEAGRLLPPEGQSAVRAAWETALGRFHARRGRRIEARSHLEASRRLAREGNDPVGERIAGLELEILARQRFPQRTWGPLTPAMRLGEETPALDRMTILGAETTFRILQRQWPEAERAAQAALDHVETNGLTGYLTAALSDLAWVKAQLGRPTESLPLFARAQKSFADDLGGVGPERIGTFQVRRSADLAARHGWTLWRLGRADEAQAVLNAGRALGLRVRRGDPPRDERAAIRAALAARPDALFLQFTPVGDDRTLLLASADQAPTIGFDLPLGTSELSQALHRWSPNVAPLVDGRAERRAARDLGAPLLDRLEAKGLLNPRRFRRLVVVGDGVAHSVPFAALIDGGGHRLIERFAVGHVLALGLDGPPLPAFATSLYAVANAGKGALAAPATLAEARDVARLFSRATLRLGPQAKVSTVTVELARHSLLLFSGHGTASVADPLDAHLELADGNLTGYDVVRLRLRAKLAVLSACETAAGDPTGGDGALSLAWAFQAAGCRSVLATTWAVNDRASHDLVVTFFKALKAGKTKDDCLRQAALATICAGRSHPYYWAGFRLIGDPRPVRF